MKQCDAGLHFYNIDVYETCPFCHEESDRTDIGFNHEENHNQGAENMSDKTQLIGETAKTAELGEKLQTKSASTQYTTPIHNPRGGSSSSPKTTILTFSDDKTSDSVSKHVLPVAGWLVIIDGEGKGKDFRLIQGENKIGRDASMEVCLDFGKQSDASVSRDAHAIVVYDNHSNEFFVERGSSRNLPTINGKTVRRDQDLQANDIIQLGETQLMFFPFCGDKFKW